MEKVLGLACAPSLRLVGALRAACSVAGESVIAERYEALYTKRDVERLIAEALIRQHSQNEVCKLEAILGHVDPSELTFPPGEPLFLLRSSQSREESMGGLVEGFHRALVESHAHQRLPRESFASWEHRRINLLIQQIEEVMSVVSQLQQDLQAVQGDEAALKQRLASEIANLQAQVSNLQHNPQDVAALQALDQGLQTLHSALTADTATAQAADPGAQPAPVPPAAGQAPATPVDPQAQAQAGSRPGGAGQGAQADPNQQAAQQGQTPPGGPAQ